MGYAFIFVGILFWVIGWYSVVFSKILMPFTGHQVLDFIKNDKYYIALLPSWILFTVMITWVNWVSMKYFRHT